MRTEIWKATVQHLSIAAFLSLAMAAPSGGKSAVAATLYTEGHADIRVAYDDGDLSLHYNFGSDALPSTIASHQFAPTDIIVKYLDEPTSRPADAKWNFTGALAGAPMWSLPQGQEDGAPYLGFAAEELEPSEWQGGIQFSLKSVVSSPPGGYFSLYQTNFFGNPIVLWDSFDGIGADDSLTLSMGGHSHYNWGFTRPGVYKLELEGRGAHAIDGLQVATDVFTFNISLGDANFDGLVDGADYTVWADNFLLTGQPWEHGDFSGDGIVDGADYTVWADNFAPQAGFSPVAAAVSLVPEPSTIALAGIGVIALGARQTARQRRSKNSPRCRLSI